MEPKNPSGNQHGTKPHNICLVMKVLEHRATELLFEKGMLEIRKAVEIDGMPLPKKPQLWVQGQKPPPQGGPFKPQVHVTGRVDAEQDDDDNDTKAWSERPIYFDEMMRDLSQSSKEVSSNTTTQDDFFGGSMAELDVKGVKRDTQVGTHAASAAQTSASQASIQTESRAGSDASVASSTAEEEDDEE